MARGRGRGSDSRILNAGTWPAPTVFQGSPERQPGPDEAFVCAASLFCSPGTQSPFPRFCPRGAARSGGKEAGQASGPSAVQWGGGHSELHPVAGWGRRVGGRRGVPQPQQPQGLGDQAPRVAPEQHLRARAAGWGGDPGGAAVGVVVVQAEPREVGGHALLRRGVLVHGLPGEMGRKAGGCGPQVTETLWGVPTLPQAPLAACARRAELREQQGQAHPAPLARSRASAHSPGADPSATSGPPPKSRP